jgi:hypothetical protein
MARGENSAEHPGRKVHRERFVTTAGTHSGFSAALDARDRDYAEAAARARLEDEYGGGAGDWDY